MISPLKNRPASALEQLQSSEKENAAKSSKKSSRGSESFSKKNVTKSINSIKDAMHALSDAIRALREKSHGLVVHFNPLFNSIDPKAPVAKYPPSQLDMWASSGTD
jgi:seryl-tRNA synthetase